jgi:diguanylate cyclase (GGDEF)-like protein
MPIPAVLLGMGAAAALLFLLPLSTPGRTPLLLLLLAAAPAAAIAGSVAAFRAVPAAAGAPWLIFAAAATAALGGQAWRGAASPAPAGADVLPYVAAMALFALGVAWILHQRDRERGAEIVLDAGLVLAAASVVTLRWSPAAAELLGPANHQPVMSAVAVLGAPIAAGCALLFGSVLLLVRGGSRAGHTAAAIAGASAAFALAVAPIALGRGDCCGPGDAAGLAHVAGWLALSYAGVRAARSGARGFRPVGQDAGGSRLRLVVAPMVALVMGAVVVDAAWRGPMNEPTAAAVGVLGLLLALRVSQLLFATSRQSAERLKLVQSRALIEVSHALSTTRELDETLELVARWAVELLEARGAVIELLTEDGASLEVRAVEGLPEAVMGLSLPLDASFSGWVVLHGKARATADTRNDPLVNPASAPFLGSATMAAAPLRYRDTTLGALSCIGRYPFTAPDIELLRALADQAAVAIENARLFRQVSQLSLTDPLTGLPNRRQLERDLSREFAAAGRGRALSVVMFDLNGFKAYNDRYGHVAGDDALRLFASALAAETRAMNMAARYGGDEFIAILADANAAGTEVFIQRVRARFPGSGADERQQSLAVAAGYAVYQPGMKQPEELVAAADRALYEDKSTRSARGVASGGAASGGAASGGAAAGGAPTGGAAPAAGLRSST